MSFSGELAMASHRSNQVRKGDSFFSSLKKEIKRHYFIQDGYTRDKFSLGWRVWHELLQMMLTGCVIPADQRD